jgi:hypothetical protein
MADNSTRNTARFTPSFDRRNSRTVAEAMALVANRAVAGSTRKPSVVGTTVKDALATAVSDGFIDDFEGRVLVAILANGRAAAMNKSERILAGLLARGSKLNSQGDAFLCQLGVTVAPRAAQGFSSFAGDAFQHARTNSAPRTRPGTQTSARLLSDTLALAARASSQAGEPHQRLDTAMLSRLTKALRDSRITGAEARKIASAMAGGPLTAAEFKLTEMLSYTPAEDPTGVPNQLGVSIDRDAARIFLAALYGE